MIIRTLAALALFGSAQGGGMGHQVGGKSVREVFEDPLVAALAEAACRGDVDGINRAVRAGADVNATGLESVTPLLWALTCENLEGMDALIQLGADPNFRDNNRTTVVYYAATYYNRELLALLLRRGGDPNALNDSGYTPLEAALTFRQSTGSSANLDVLLEAGADTSIRNQGGDTILDLAAMVNQYEVVFQLLRRGYSGDRQRLLRIITSGSSSNLLRETAQWRERVIAELQGGEPGNAESSPAD